DPNTRSGEDTWPITINHHDRIFRARSVSAVCGNLRIASFEIEGSSRRNVYTREEAVEQGSPTIQITKRELQRMMDEVGRNAIVAYERRTATPVIKEAARRQLFHEEVERTMEVASRRDQEQTRGPGTSKAGSSNRGKSKAMPDLQKYDGTKDPLEHVAAFELVMNLYRQFGPIMAKLFVTTLAGKAQEWFTSLPSGSIETYDQLTQKFSFHFVSKRKQKRSATHLFTIRQGENEPLKKFMGIFNNETLEVQDLRIDMMLSVLIHGLKKGPFSLGISARPTGGRGVIDGYDDKTHR
ncbi:UNVERIFIED_CONTAM: hypothetical protein Sindi_1644200, partial [Sesamum indicum]